MITLYTLDCPKCNVLEKKLKMKCIEYNVVKDIEIMRKKGFAQVPVLEIDNQVYDFNNAIKFVNNYTKDE